MIPGAVQFPAIVLRFGNSTGGRTFMRFADIKDHNGNEIAVSRIILGTALFGAAMSREESFDIMDTYFAHGGRAFDTARVYSDWLPNGHNASERTVGEWIRARDCRSEVVLMTKGAHPSFADMHKSRLSPEEIRADFHESLRILQTDYVDVYFLHRDDEAVPVSVIVDTLDEFVKTGKARMLGASNWRAERILEANEYARASGRTPFSVSEIQWSYAVCTPRESFGDDTLVCMDEKQMELYRRSGIPVFAFSSQAHGVFSCGYKEDLSDLADKHKCFYSEENVQRYQALLKKCRETGRTPSQTALDYITENDEVKGFAIVGCSKKAQLLEALAAAE